MIDEDNKGIANLLNLPVRTPVRKPKVETQEDPLVSFSESLINMKSLELPKSDPVTTKPGGKKIENSYQDQYNKYFNKKSDQYYKNQTPKKKIGVMNYITKMKNIYEGGEDKIDPPILRNNINDRYVNKSLNKFENRTDNKNVVTFDPTTQLFTDETRNIAFKSYDQAKRWNDAVNGQPTATGQQVNKLKARLDNSRAYGYDPKDEKDNRKQKVVTQTNKNRRLI